MLPIRFLSLKETNKNCVSCVRHLQDGNRVLSFLSPRIWERIAIPECELLFSELFCSYPPVLASESFIVRHYLEFNIWFAVNKEILNLLQVRGIRKEQQRIVLCPIAVKNTV